MRSLQLKHEFELEVEKRAKKCLQQEKDSLENELNISKQEVTALKSTVAKMTADSLGITTELQATKVSLGLPSVVLSVPDILIIYSLIGFSVLHQFSLYIKGAQLRCFELLWPMATYKLNCL